MPSRYQVQAVKAARFAVSFVPQVEKPHTVNIAFNQRTIPRSPFIIQVKKTMSKILPVHPGPLFSAVNSLTSLLLQGDINSQHLFACVTDPEGGLVPFTLKAQEQDKLAVEYKPVAVGQYHVEVKYHDQVIEGSPFVCKIFDINRIKVTDIPKPAILGVPASFLVQTAGGGPGSLEISINNGQISTSSRAESPTLYSIHFTPDQLVDHVIDVRFNGIHVPGSCFNCPILDLSQVKLVEDIVDRVQIGDTCKFALAAGGQQLLDLKANIVEPNGNLENNYQITQNGDLHVLEFRPESVGDYAVDFCIEDTSLLKAPLAVKVFDASKVKVRTLDASVDSSAGRCLASFLRPDVWLHPDRSIMFCVLQVSDITSGTTEDQVSFNIDACSAGHGDLEIIVCDSSGKNVPNYVESKSNASFKVNFKPK